MTKLYVIADQSLSNRQQFVQGTHAVAQFALDFPDTHKEKWGNRTLVMLKGPKLKTLERILQEEGIEYSKFHEPHFGNKLTALCALDINEYVEHLELI